MPPPLSRPHSRKGRWGLEGGRLAPVVVVGRGEGAHDAGESAAPSSIRAAAATGGRGGKRRAASELDSLPIVAASRLDPRRRRPLPRGYHHLVDTPPQETRPPRPCSSVADSWEAVGPMCPCSAPARKGEEGRVDEGWGAPRSAHGAGEAEVRGGGATLPPPHRGEVEHSREGAVGMAGPPRAAPSVGGHLPSRGRTPPWTLTSSIRRARSFAPPLGARARAAPPPLCHLGGSRGGRATPGSSNCSLVFHGADEGALSPHPCSASGPAPSRYASVRHQSRGREGREGAPRATRAGEGEGEMECRAAPCAARGGGGRLVREGAVDAARKGALREHGGR
jgi:hypothetical protein